MSSLSSYSYVFFLWANLFGTSGPFVCPSISLLQIFIFKFLIKSPAILGNFRAFKVTEIFGLCVADPRLENATKGLRKDISVITKITGTRHIA